ncbi:hypothetical protein Poly41_01270 [Novipirellula artificiosorum]|uniref:Sialate O-acetylesterase domain-containing protein n=2 Tax=Novipirellula artificiosorum TaxID=2528016 RepID=A0A5C6DZG9_9BACT|nr:hypothetical protein Poly41_01270 [Novipirellula artificiosorum]
MYRIVILHAFLLLFVLIQKTDAKPPIRVFLVAGQSNAVGYDAPPQALPASDIDETVRFWWRCGDPPPDEHDSMSGRWVTLRHQPVGDPIKPKSGRQYGNYAQREGGFGPEMGFARTLAPRSPLPIAIIKIAFSGTHVAGDWNPNLSDREDSEDPNDSRGACYRSLLAETHQAISQLSQTYAPEIEAIVWVQGESDAQAAYVDAYQTNITTMIQELRKDLATPNLWVMLGVNTRFGGGHNPFMPKIVAAQQAVAHLDPHVQYVDCDGASIANHAHFDGQGTLQVGTRFANTLLRITAGR